MNSKLRSTASRLSRTWIWNLILIFFALDLVVFSVVAYELGGPALFDDYAGLRETLRFLYLPVFSVEGVILLWALLFHRRKIRKRLRPLQEIAHTTQRLAEQAGQDRMKFHTLEDAVSKISPTAPQSVLTTGDADLAGLERAINDLLERMRASYQQQSRFVSDASHELRTPIAVIEGYVNMLDRWGKSDETVLDESIAAIKSESGHMKRLVEQLLFLARGDSGRTQLNFQDVSLSELMEDVSEEYGMIDTGHVFQLQDSGDVRAYGDASMLKQTARILVDNAVKYSPAGETVTLRAGFNEKGAPYFAVQDAGVGIREADVAHVFERFFRADDSRTRDSGGTGLGLSIAKWIVDQHGGHFEVLTRPELGTRIRVVLPKRQAGA